jgi:hypothetical protein
MVATPATNPRPAGESVNEAEARAILEEELGKLRRLSHDELVSRFADRQETFEVTGETGESYQVELQALWDDRGKRTLLVIGRRRMASLSSPLQRLHHRPGRLIRRKRTRFKVNEAGASEQVALDGCETRASPGRREHA